jgi:hypothetical protein
MAVAAVASVAVLSAVATADTGAGGTQWDFEVTPNKAGMPSKSHSIGKPAKKGDDGKYIAPKVQIFGFPKGSKVDTTALKQCGLTPSEVGRGEECPKNTLLGDGSANVVVGQSATTTGTELIAEFTAYNQKNKILFIFQTCGEGTGPGTGTDCAPAGPPNIVVGNWSGLKTQPKLRVPTPQNLLDIGVIIIRFELFTDKHVVKKKGKVVKSYIFNPTKCTKKGWATFDQATYVDGSKQTIKDSQKCKA